MLKLFQPRVVRRVGSRRRREEVCHAEIALVISGGKSLPMSTIQEIVRD